MKDDDSDILQLDVDLDSDDLDLTEDDDDMPETTCPWCGAVFAGNHVGHCTGGPFRKNLGNGHYSGCCQNFASLHAFDAHRVGPIQRRRCLSTDKLAARGWTQTGPYASWRTPAPEGQPWKGKQ